MFHRSLFEILLKTRIQLFRISCKNRENNLVSRLSHVITFNLHPEMSVRPTIKSMDTSVLDWTGDLLEIPGVVGTTRHQGVKLIHRFQIFNKLDVKFYDLFLCTKRPKKTLAILQ